MYGIEGAQDLIGVLATITDRISNARRRIHPDAERRGYAARDLD